MKLKIKDTEIEFIKADITELKVEAIVNAANNMMLMGGGVAGAIKRKGGKEIEDEAKALAPVEVGSSLITSGGKLPARYVIHTATMGMDFQTDYSIVRQCTRSVLKLCREKGISEVAFPALGAGVGGLDVALVSKIMAQEVFKAIMGGYAPKKVLFVYYSRTDFEKGLTAYRYLEHLEFKTKEGPFLTVDAVVFDGLAHPRRVVLIERKNPPFGWALPGGFVDYGETVEEAVKRELAEETGLEYRDYKQLKVYSGPGRDERFHTVTVAFVGWAEGEVNAASDAASGRWFEIGALPEPIAFDHREIIKDALSSISTQ